MTTIEGTTSTGKKRSVLLYSYQLMDCIHLEIISDHRSYAEVNLSDEEAEKLYQALGQALGKEDPETALAKEVIARLQADDPHVGGER
jgi:hypothetical protein